MAYPPAALPINMTDATPQQTTHPDLHNKTAQAVNDIIAELGANPSGAAATVEANFTRRSIPNNILGFDHSNGDGFRIASASTIVTTNPSGAASIALPAIFTMPPLVFVQNGEPGLPNVTVTLYTTGVTTGAFSVLVWNTVSQVALPNAGVRINWLAIGQ